MPINRALFLAIAFLPFCIAFVWLLSTVGMNYPIPWPDESSFLWQAIAVQEHNSLFAPEVHPERDAMWMPPGYAIFMGTIFKFTGFSLELSRQLSAALVLLSFSGIVLLCSRQRLAFWMVLLTGVFLLSDRVILSSNMARMEPLTIALAFAGIALVARHFWYAGMCVLALSVLVHPNGLHFGLVASIYSLWYLVRKPKTFKPGALDFFWIVLALGLAAWYGLYVLNHWADFVVDMGGQVNFKSGIAGARRLAGEGGLQPHLLYPIIFTAISLPLLRGEVARTIQLLSLSLISLNLLSFGAMYGIYEIIAMLLAGILILMLLAKFWPTENRVSLPLNVCAMLIVIVVYGFQVHWKYLQLWPLATDSLSHAGMRGNPTTPWLLPEEEQFISKYLDNLNAESPKGTRVLFLPSADALIFYREAWSNLTFLAHSFHHTPTDVVIAHVSPAIPQSLDKWLWLTVFASKTPLGEKREIYRRDEGTYWEVYHRAAPDEISLATEAVP